jgi:hypothetical protein
MDLSDDGWMPPDGDYTVIVEDVPSGIKEKNGVNNAWLKPVFNVLDGEFKSRTFSDYFWIEPSMTEPSISIKNLCRYATCLAGSETKDPIAASAIALESTGEILDVQVYRTKSRKTGKIYANIRFLRRIDATEVVAEAATEGDS